MADIVTLTMNPAIDLSTAVERVAPERKLRCEGLRRDPGGGGINVARVIARLGGSVSAFYTTGGIVGRLLAELVEREGVAGVPLEIAADTREDFTVLERGTGDQFRFVLEGPRVTASEWQASLARLASLGPFPRYVVASGSLPPGVPDDFYGHVARLARERGASLVLDTSGPPLEHALACGVFMIKPNLNELARLLGIQALAEEDAARACRRLVAEKKADVVALTLGNRGALLTTADATWRAPVLPLEPVSAVGAGDSFVGAMVWALAAGHALETAFCYGAAGGSAALLTPGTELCRADDVLRLVDQVVLQQVDG